MDQSFVREKIIFIINPNSGTRYKGRLPEIINELTDNTVFEVEVVTTKYKGEATEIVLQKLGENYRYFVAVGGDGTVNEVAKAMINTGSILGIIPVGSGNGLARHLKIPLQPPKAIALINRLKTDTIDYGLVNDIPFFCTCGVGFDALIGEKFEENKRRGLTSYIKTVFREYFNYTPESYEIAIDNQQKIERKAFLITFANGSQYGNNALIAPRADICDGKLDISILSPFRFYHSLMIGIRLFTGNIDKSRLLTCTQASRVVVKRGSDSIIHFDGETCQMDKTLTISIINKGLSVLIP